MVGAYSSLGAERYLSWTKVVIGLFGYAPYLFVPRAIRLVPVLDRYMAVGLGLYLLLSAFLQTRRFAANLPEGAKGAWLAVDTVVWLWSEHLVRWQGPSSLYGLILAGDAALLGWTAFRGLLHFAAVTIPIVVGPLVTGRPLDESYFSSYLLLMVPGLFFVYGFIYMVQRMNEEKDEAARARTEAELANGQLKAYLRQVEELAVLRERNRLAREVHDTIAHGFTGILMQMELVGRLIERDPARAAAAVANVQEKARQSLNEVRRSVHALRPLEMEERQGMQAVAKLVSDFGGTAGVQTDLVVAGEPAALTVAQELCIFRAVQEGLTNAFRHGRAKRARVRVTYKPDEVQVAVEDDGRGAKGPVAGGLGITGIRERAQALGGRVDAGTAPTGGFVLQVTLPLKTGEGVPA